MNRGIRRVTEAQVRRELMRENDRLSRRRWRVGAAVVLCLALLAGMAASRLLLVLADVRSDAMGAALRGGDVALCLRTDAPIWGGRARRGELVLIRYADSGLWRQAVRRVVAVAGDAVTVSRDGRVTLNGEALEEPYASYGQAQDAPEPGGALENPFAQPETVDAEEAAASGASYSVEVPEGALLVLCDDRANALDSRSDRIGLLSEADVLGRVRAIVWPVYRAGLWIEE